MRVHTFPGEAFSLYSCYRTQHVPTTIINYDAYTPPTTQCGIHDTSFSLHNHTYIRYVLLHNMSIKVLVTTYTGYPPGVVLTNDTCTHVHPKITTFMLGFTGVHYGSYRIHNEHGCTQRPFLDTSYPVL